MEMWHALLGIRTSVHDRSVAGLLDSLLGRDCCRCSRDSTHQIRGRGSERRHMFTRNHQDMYRCLRVDISKCDDSVVLIHHLRRDLTRHDPAEQTLRHGSV